jgi:thiol:disulfide interchange protein DsbA
MADFLAPQGVDKDKFLSHLDSFAIKGQIERPRNWPWLTTGVPTMIVNGKYRFDMGSAGSRKRPELADQLIAKERASAKGAQ